MFPVLFEVPAFEAWIGALLAALLGGVFAFFAWRNREDKGSWWLAGGCVVGAVALLVHYGARGVLGPLPIRLFGILVVLGFLAATQVMAKRNVRLGLLTGEESFDLAFYILLAGLAGARLLHVLQNFERFSGHPLDMIAIWDGGLVWYGAAVAGTFFGWYWIAKRKRDLWTASDSLALAVPLGHAIGRLGCFAAGCDYGKVVEGGTASVPWAVHFPGKDPYSLVPKDLRIDPESGDPVWLHPTQLYLALFNLLVFALLFWIDRKRKKGAFPGRLSALYLITYALGRAGIEHWRGDADRGLYFGGAVSFSQVVSALVLVAGILMYRTLKGRIRPSAAA